VFVLLLVTFWTFAGTSEESVFLVYVLSKMGFK
jgi:hypothetical protein